MKPRVLFIQLITIFSVIILFNACSKNASGRAGTVEEVDGITIVKNPIEPLNPELQIAFEEDLTIGVEEGNENYMFGNEVFVNTDDEGNFYVTDGDRKTVRKFDSKGIFLKSIGRAGQGPGEFQNISEVKFDIEENIYLYDVDNQRISFLDKEGSYLKSIKAPSFFERVVVNSRGSYIARSVDNVEVGQGKKWDYFYGFFDDDFNLVAEFLRLPQEVKSIDKNNASPAQIFADSLSREAFVPFVNYTLDENDIIYFGYPKNYEIRVFSPEGKLTKIIQRDHKPIEINASHKNISCKT